MSRAANYFTYLLSIVLLIAFSSCQKEEFSIQEPASIVSPQAKSKGNPKANKITICHKSGNSYSIAEINANALSGHLNHGDVILEDQDGDGFYPDNECGYGPMGDCDDLDPTIHPDAEEVCDDGVDNDCDGLIDDDDSDCITPFIFVTDFDSSNDFGFAVGKEWVLQDIDFGNGAYSGNDGNGLTSTGPESTTRSRYFYTHSLGKLTFDLAAICDNCNDQSVSTFFLEIETDEGIFSVIGLKTIMSQYGWNYNSGETFTTSFDEPIYEGIDDNSNIPSSFEITNIPAGTLRIYININGQYVRGDGDVWAIDNLVLQNM